MKEKNLTNDHYMIDKVLNKIKVIIGIRKFDYGKILIDMHYKLLNDTAKNDMVSMTLFVK